MRQFKEISDFVLLSLYAGEREDLVQAGGGNSSVKTSYGEMLIKASGIQLSEISENYGFVRVNYHLIRDFLATVNHGKAVSEQDTVRLMKESVLGEGRPSIETFLHAVTERFTLHTHPIVVNALTCRKNGNVVLKELFPRSLIIPYATPGIELAINYIQEFSSFQEKFGQSPNVIFLMNHGLLVSAESSEQVIALTEKVTRHIESYLGVKDQYDPYHDLFNLQSLFGTGIIWRVTDSNALTALVTLGEKWNHCFCPDSIVFLGKGICRLRDGSVKEQFADYVAQNGLPVIVLYKGCFYIHASSVKKALQVQSVLSFSAQVQLLNRNQQCAFLNRKEQDRLLHWDAEKYRQNVK